MFPEGVGERFGGASKCFVSIGLTERGVAGDLHLLRGRDSSQIRGGVGGGPDAVVD